MASESSQSDSQMMVVNELWHIYTYYSLHGDPLDPEHLRSSQLIKMFKDCNLIKLKGLKDSPLPEHGSPFCLILEADVFNAYQAEVTRSDKIAPGDATHRSALKMSVGGPVAKQHTDRKKMNFDDFLSVLVKLSVKVFRTSGVETKDEAFEKLLGEKILPFASRRTPDHVSSFMANAEIMGLFAEYDDAFTLIFGHYASGNEKTSQSVNDMEDKGVRVAGSRDRHAHGYKPMNNMKEAMTYADFLRFASAFELSNTVLLTTFELGDIFLSSLEFCKPKKGEYGYSESLLRALSYTEFLQALVRCALVAYSKISYSTILHKIKGLFLYMWRSINKSVPKAMGDSRRASSTYTGDLLAGTGIFNRKFIARWASDNHCDYLSLTPVQPESGKRVMERIFESSQSARALANSAAAPYQQPADQHQDEPYGSSSSRLAASASSSSSGSGSFSAGTLQQQQQQQQQYLPQQQQYQQQQYQQQYLPQQQQYQQQYLPQQQQYQQQQFSQYAPTQQQSQPQLFGGGGGGGGGGGAHFAPMQGGGV